MTPDKTPETPDIAATAALAEKNRVAAITAMAKDYPDIAAKAVSEKWTTEQVEAAITQQENKDLKAKLAQRDEQDKRPSVPSITAGKNGIIATPDILAASACLTAGMKGAEKAFGADVCGKASDLRLRSITELVKASLALEGKTLDCSRHDTRQFIEAAFSTRAISNILSNVANKFVLEGYGVVESVWQEIASIRSVVDFKENKGVRMVMSDLLKEVAGDGKLSHGKVSDETRSIAAKTKGLIIGLSRQDLINDDLGVLADMPRRLGFAAARTLNTDIWKVVNASAGQFTSARGNTLTGALTLDNLKKAEELYLQLKDADGNPIGLQATVLLTGPTHSAAARELFTSTNLVGGSNRAPAQNIYAGVFKPVVSSYADKLPWFLIAPPMAAPLIEVAFLNGRQEPFVETADADFDQLGINMRCYYDYGVEFAEWRGAVRSSGV